MLISFFACLKIFLFNLVVIVSVFLSSCKNCDNKKQNDNSNIVADKISLTDKNNVINIINFGQDILQTSKAMTVIAINSPSSFSNKESLFLEFMQTRGNNFIKDFAPGPFGIDVFESISDETFWELKQNPDILVWYSKNMEKGDFLITDASGIPQKSFVKTIVNGNEFVCFLFLEESLTKDKIYYIYFKQGDKFSFVQNVKFIN